MVSRSSIFGSTWNVLYDLINSNVSDPDNRNSKWIFPSYPEFTIKEGENKKLMKTKYPLIIIPEVITSEDIETFTGSFITFKFSIEVYCTARGELKIGGAERSDSISDDIYEAIVGNKSDLETEGIFYTKIIGRDVGTFQRDGITVHYSILNFEAKWYNSRV